MSGKCQHDQNLANSPAWVEQGLIGHLDGLGGGVSAAFQRLASQATDERAQWRGTTLKTDKNVVITSPHSKVRLMKGTVSHVPR